YSAKYFTTHCVKDDVFHNVLSTMTTASNLPFAVFRANSELSLLRETQSLSKAILSRKNLRQDESCRPIVAETRSRVIQLESILDCLISIVRASVVQLHQRPGLRLAACQCLLCRYRNLTHLRLAHPGHFGRRIASPRCPCQYRHCPSLLGHRGYHWRTGRLPARR